MIHEWTVRPIVSWPGKITLERVTSPFYAGWTNTQDILDREFSALNARKIVLQMAVTERDFRIDGQLRADARPEHPGVILSFDSLHGPLRYDCDKFNDWHDNVRAIALSLEALRKVNRYGVSRGGEQYAGWKALPDGVLTREQAEALLRSYGGEAEALRKTHPDHGGSRDEFERVMAARKLLRGAS